MSVLSWRRNCLCLVVLLLPIVTLAVYSPTHPRFTASYMRKMSLSLNEAMTSAEWDVLGQSSSDLFELRKTALSTASTVNYEEFAMGTADIDTLDNLFRFNITYLNFSTDGKGVQNSKPRATTLLMYDVVIGTYNSSQLYRSGTNFTWATQSCACNQITLTSGGGSAPMLALPPNAVNQGLVSISVNKKTIQSTLWTYETIGFIPSENDHAPVALPINYQFYVSTINNEFLDRVSYTFFFASGSSSTVQYDFWSPNVMISSFMIVPDTSCAKSCYNSLDFSVRAQPISLYPSTCDPVLGAACMCQNFSQISRPFCRVPWAISSDIDIEVADKYAMQIKNLTVDAQPSPIPLACATEMQDFICRFYFPPCDPFNARLRPPINGTLKCWESNHNYFNLQGSITNSDEAFELARIWEAYQQHKQDSMIHDDERRAEDGEDATQGPISINPSFVPVEPPKPSEAPKSAIPIPEEHIPTVFAPEEHSQPELMPQTAPAPIAIPTAPSLMSNDSIAYATSFVTFSSYNVVAKVSITYPDIYTLKNWQIALMLFGTIGLLLTIIVSIVMANRRVVNHFEKV